MIRLLVVDDSEFVHSMLGSIVAEEHDIEIVGNGYSGEEGVRLHMELEPDVVIMDVEMPGMGGLEATGEIMSRLPKPVIIFSGAGKRVAHLAFKSLEQGAVEIIEKPDTENYAELEQFVRNNLLEKIRLFADFRVVRRINEKLISRLAESGRKLEARAGHKDVSKSSLDNEVVAKPVEKKEYHGKVVGIAASTGGPQTLRHLFDLCQMPFSFPLILLQHIPPGFFSSFCEWIDGQVPCQVKLAEHGEYPQPGIIYVANEGKHLGIDINGAFSYVEGEPVFGIRPCADVLFSSMAEQYKECAVAIVLTGMGHDGQLGAVSIKKHSGMVVAQPKEGCILYGMPKAVIEAGLADKVLSIELIANFLNQLSKQCVAS